MAVMDSLQAPKLASHQISLWLATVDHLLKAHRALLAGSQAVFSSGHENPESPQEVFSQLTKWSTGAHSLYDQCEAQYLCGAMHFIQGNHKTSLSLWRSVLDRDPHHVEVWPALTWNCLLLGLTTDARTSDRHYRKFHDQHPQERMYKHLCDGLQRYSTLVCLAEGLKSGNIEIIQEFRSRWQSLGLKSAAFDYEILFVIGSVLQSDRLEAKTQIQTLYHAWPHEWLPVLLWALLAHEEKDWATCDDRIHQALKKAPQQKGFIDQMASVMLPKA